MAGLRVEPLDENILDIQCFFFRVGLTASLLAFTPTWVVLSWMRSVILFTGWNISALGTTLRM